MRNTALYVERSIDIIQSKIILQILQNPTCDKLHTHTCVCSCRECNVIYSYKCLSMCACGCSPVHSLCLPTRVNLC